jgi:acylphosphatase
LANLSRAEYIVTGRVQRAGYRYWVDKKAYHLAITGMVENLSDGTVRVVAEGEPDKLREFQEALRVEEYPIRVEDVRKEKEERIGRREYKDFLILRGDEEGRPKEIADKLDLAAFYLRETGGSIGAKIEGFQKATTEKFDALDEKYGKVSEHLERMSQANQETAERLREISKTNQETAKYQEETSKHLARLAVLVEKIAEDRARR